MNSFYITAVIFCVILYTYRHAMLVLLLGCNFKGVEVDGTTKVQRYCYPDFVKVGCFLCRNKKGVVSLSSIASNHEYLKEVSNLVVNLPFYKYFPYSIIVFFLGLFYLLNFAFLSIFFNKSVVQTMLYFFDWIQKKVFSLFFKSYFSEKRMEMVLF